MVTSYNHSPQSTSPFSKIQTLRSYVMEITSKYHFFTDDSPMTTCSLFLVSRFPFPVYPSIRCIQPLSLDPPSLCCSKYRSSEPGQGRSRHLFVVFVVKDNLKSVVPGNVD